MVIMEKNNPLYVGYDECMDGSNEKRGINYTLDGDDPAKGSK